MHYSRYTEKPIAHFASTLANTKTYLKHRRKFACGGRGMEVGSRHKRGKSINTALA